MSRPLLVFGEEALRHLPVFRSGAQQLVSSFILFRAMLEEGVCWKKAQCKISASLHSCAKAMHVLNRG